MKIAKKIYVAMWSIGLLVATYPCLLSLHFPFDFTSNVAVQSNVNPAKSYYYSLMMVMELFLFDVIYAFALEYSNNDGKVNRFLEVLILLSLFLLLFAFSLYSDNVWVLGCCFIGSWIVLTIMKYLKTEAPCDNSPTSKGTKINQ